MNWLKEHVYPTTWIGIPVAIIFGIIKNRHAQSGEIDWSRMLIYSCFLTCLGVVFIPTFGEGARHTEELFLSMSFFAILMLREH